MRHLYTAHEEPGRDDSRPISCEWSCSSAHPDRELEGFRGLATRAQSEFRAAAIRAALEAGGYGDVSFAAVAGQGGLLFAGCAHSSVTVYSGEDELRALAEGVCRVLNGEEQAKVFQPAESALAPRRERLVVHGLE